MNDIKNINGNRCQLLVYNSFFLWFFKDIFPLEATAKNVAYGNKNEFFLHRCIFFCTFAG